MLKVIRFILYLNRTIQDVFHKELDNKTSVSIFEYLKIKLKLFVINSFVYLLYYSNIIFMSIIDK